MSNKNRSPYQPSLPQKKVVKPPVSMGYPSPKSVWELKTSKEIQAATKILQELGIENSAVDFVKLLKDERRLDKAVRKLKLKAFW